MATPVVTVAAGGLPVVDVTATKPLLGAAVTEALNGRGMPVTKVAGGGVPVTFSTIADWPPVVPPFTPATGLTGLIGWWDASVFSSFNLTSTTINSMADQSGRAQTMVGGLHAFAKPVYNATGFNTSFPAVMIDTAVGSAMETNVGFPMGTGNTLTWFVVGTRAGATSNASPRHLSYAIIANGDFNNIGTWCWGYASGQTPISFSRLSATYPTVSIPIVAGNHIMIGTVNASGVVTAYIDGVKTVCQTAPGNWVNGGVCAVGKGAIIASAGTFTTAAFAEWGVATGYSDDATVAQLYTYLKNKWGL